MAGMSALSVSHKGHQYDWDSSSNTKIFFTGFIDKFKSNRHSFTCENFETEFRLLLRVFREQLVWLFVKFLFYSKPRSHFGRNFVSLASLVRRNWRWLRKQRWICTLVHTYTYTLDSTLEWAPNLGSPVNTIATCSHLTWSSEHCSDLKKYK